MPNTRQTRVKRTDNNAFLVPVLIAIGLTTALAFGLASVWQAKQTPPDPQNLITSSSEAPQSSSGESSSELGSSSEEASSSSEASSTPKATVGQAVPESERVRSEYFDDALFVGDSITTGIKLYDIMSNTEVIASTGINLDTVLHKELIETDSGETLTVLDAMSKEKPNKIYIMLGANGVAFFSPEKTAELYGTFLDAVKAQHPDAIIYVQSILPINEEKFHKKYSGDITNAKIDQTNAEIQKVTAERNLYYLNVAEAFKDETGGLPTDSTPDGLHFGSEQYIKWFDYLKTHTTI